MALIRIVALRLAAPSVEFLQQASGIANLALLWAMLHCYFSREATAEWVCRREKREVTAMGWFRSRSRLGAYLALFALAFQLAVSFAHVHLEHASPIAAGARAQLADQASAPSSRSDHEDLADDLCPICSLIHLAGTIMPAEMPPVPLPQVFGSLRLKAAVAIDVSASHRVVFQARAPPIV
jgi:hypothetical protein